MAEPLLERAVASVADRLSVDWSALEREANSADDKALIDCLRILGGVGNLHRTMSLDTADSDRTTREVIPTSGDSRVPPSSMWGRFRMDAQVGEGGFGRVYRAWDPQLEREIAIKILHRRIADTRMRAALLSEGRALAKIHHPHVVNVLGVETRGDEIGLCMEFVHGRTLEDALRQDGPMHPRDVALLGSDLCRALEAVHRAGFVHRDVKARNVMRDENGRVVLMDFGAGQQSQPDGTGQPVSIVGTPLYMAPEVLAGQPATPGSDIYCLGVLLYRLVTGEYPVEGQSVDEIRAAHMQGRKIPVSKRRPELPATFTRAMDRALASDPAKRYGTALDFLRDLAVTAAPATLRQRLGAVAMRVAATTVTIWVLGFLCSSFFDYVVGRYAPFNRESPFVWLEMGVRSLVMPLAYAVVMFTVFRTVRFGLELLTLAPPIGRLATVVRDVCERMSRALNLRSPQPFTRATAALGLVALATIVFTFSDLLRAAVLPISDFSSADLQPLQWDRRFAPVLYRIALTALTLLIASALIRLRRLRANPLPSRWNAAPLWALLTIAILLAEMPYRLLWQNITERVSVAQDRCYLLGTSPTEALVHCPDVAPPRNRTVALSDARLRRTGARESLFSPLTDIHEGVSQ